MKIQSPIGLLIVAAVLLFAASGACLGQRSTRSTAEFFRMSDNSLVNGASSTLVRTDNGVSMSLHTNDLRPGAYTVWWVFENYPENCTERPCSLADEENPLVQTSVLNATGAVVGANGIGNFGASIGIGGPYNGEILFGEGLLNPRGADVYFVARYHGPVIAAMITQQLTMYEGGCDINNCSDDQISFHISNE